ncbi:hypothetical protein E9232_001766 [Inquilinus ginsengisoli]|uniref:Uncharacterized protein n=1 Tax=Inquilinus ginsengisoli TaxID=363840 RepID=A0ABU1JKV5_9PROT|nr:hypothetical protein [Inquilinus ginsengisoli]MDR6289251.1 hypothetical protein [Inquilinus ginsengisoli]
MIGDMAATIADADGISMKLCERGGRERCVPLTLGRPIAGRAACHCADPDGRPGNHPPRLGIAEGRSTVLDRRFSGRQDMASERNLPDRETLRTADGTETDPEGQRVIERALDTSLARGPEQEGGRRWTLPILVGLLAVVAILLILALT